MITFRPARRPLERGDESAVCLSEDAMGLRATPTSLWPGLLLVLLSLCPTTSRASGPEPPASAPGEILIKFKPGAGLAAPGEALALVGGVRLKQFRSGAQHWKVADGLSTEEAIASLKGDPRIAYVEPNYILTAAAIPDDPDYPLQWPLRNTGQAGGLPGADIDAQAAWNSSTGSRRVLVGVIDTGVDYTHPDLAANIWTNPGEIPDNFADDDGNGYVDDVHGWDFVNDDNDPFDDGGHGTSVAGIIGAMGNNGLVPR